MQHTDKERDDLLTEISALETVRKDRLVTLDQTIDQIEIQDLNQQLQYLAQARDQINQFQQLRQQTKLSDQDKEKASKHFEDAENLILRAKASDYVMAATNDLLRGPRMINDATRDLEKIILAFFRQH